MDDSRREDGRARSRSSHAALVPGGVFEFQHSSGTDMRDSFAKGFKSWAELDLPVFLDALRAEGRRLHGHDVAGQ